jgi:hypothetical protein
MVLLLLSRGCLFLFVIQHIVYCTIPLYKIVGESQKILERFSSGMEDCRRGALLPFKAKFYLNFILKVMKLPAVIKPIFPPLSWVCGLPFRLPFSGF